MALKRLFDRSSWCLIRNNRGPHKYAIFRVCTDCVCEVFIADFHFMRIFGWKSHFDCLLIHLQHEIIIYTIRKQKMVCHRSQNAPNIDNSSISVSHNSNVWINHFLLWLSLEHFVWLFIVFSSAAFPRTQRCQNAINVLLAPGIRLQHRCRACTVTHITHHHTPFRCEKCWSMSSWYDF